MNEAELRRCQIAEWYPKFKQFTFRTLFHPLPYSFLRYLDGLPPVSGDSDGEDDPPPALFLLPRPASGRDPLPRTTALDPTSLLDSSTSFSDDDDDDEEEEADAPSFPELEAAVERSIAALGGAAFPKLNWSAPKDAAWIAADGTLRCSSFADVALLLRASDSIAHDLSQALPSCSDGADQAKSQPFGFCLALRKWYPSLRPEMEFRCFVRRKRLVGVSQREVTNFYPVLLDRRDEIQPLIEKFFAEVVEPRFESENYTFDVYVTGDSRVKLIDFNPWAAFTLPLLFSWEELEKEEKNRQQGEDDEENGQQILLEFRVVEGQCGVRPGLKTAVPFDYLDTGEGSGWDQFLKKADEEFKKQSQSQQHDVEG